MGDICQYWIEHFGIDGIRLDYTKGIYLPGAGAPGLFQLIEDIRECSKPPFYVSIEHIDSYGAIHVANEVNATSCWYDDFYWTSRNYLKEGSLGPGLMRLLNSSKDFGAGRVPTTYIENHDHARAAWAAGGREQWYRTQPWMLALMTSYGAPLVYNGQEFGLDHWMPEPHEEEHSPVKRVTPRPLNWDLSEDEVGKYLRGLYRRLIAIRKSCPALTGPEFFPDQWEDWMSEPND